MKKTVHIEGMSCHHCVLAVEQALKSVGGISVDQVEIGSATFQVEDSGVDLSRVKEAIEGEGYTVVDL